MSRRKSVRMSINKPIYLSDPSGQVAAKAVNISSEGMFVQSRRHFQLGDQLSLQLRDNNQAHAMSLDALCAVVRVCHQADVFLLGLQFVNKFVTKVPKQTFRQPVRQGQKVLL